MKFKPVFIEATTINDAYHQLLWNLREFGRRYYITSGSYEGSYRLAFDDVSGFIHHPHVRPLAVSMPEGSNLPNPTTEEDIEKYFVNYLMDSNLQPNEHYKYATWIVGGRYHPPDLKCVRKDESLAMDLNYIWDKPIDILVPNQIQWIIDHFKNAGFGNEHCYLTVGYPQSNFAYNLPYTDETERGTSPCLRGLDFRIIGEEYLECNNCNYERDIDDFWEVDDFCPMCFDNFSRFKLARRNYLLTKVIYRSWNLYSGFPVNLAGIVLLNEYIANKLEIEPGPLSFTCKSLHAYDFEIPVIEQRLGK